MESVDWPIEAARRLGAEPAALLLSTFQPGEGFPHRHVHDVHTELFAVVSGAVEVVIGEEQDIFGAGEAVLVTPGTPHSFAATEDGPAEIAIVVSPPDVVRMITELGGAGGDRGAIDAVLRRYASRLI